jgi:DNA-binding beta-propeller fold protein YncE
VTPTRRQVLIGLAGVAATPLARAAVAAGNALPLPAWPGQVVEPLALFRCGPQPKGIAISPDGREMWVTFLGGPPSVGVYSLEDGRVGAELATIWLGDHGAVEPLFREDGRTVWVSQMETHRVHEIDVATRLRRRTLIEASPDGRRLYVSNWNFDDVSEIDLVEGKTVRRLPTVKTPRGLYATRDGTTLYVAGFGDGALERIDLATGARTTCFRGTALRHLCASAHERFLFATDMGAKCIWRWDLEDEVVVRLATTDSHPNTCALADGGRVLCVSNHSPNGDDGYLADGPAWGSCLLFDSTTGAVLDSIVGGNQCTALAVSPDGRTLAFSDFRDDTVRVYRIPPYEALAAAGWPRRDVHAKDLWKHR